MIKQNSIYRYVWSVLAATFFVCVVFSYMQRAAQTPSVAISFLIADLKWNAGTLKILELGEGPQSQFQGFDSLYGVGTIWASFWNYLQHYNVPMWYIGRLPCDPKELAFDQFLAQGGRVTSSLQELEKDSRFTYYRQQKIENYQQIASYRGVLIFSNHGYPNWYENDLRAFKKRNPGFLVVNDVVTPYVNHKKNTSRLFTKDLSVYRPRWGCYKKYYYQTLDQDILAALSSPIVVIKPLNAANGWGNLIVTKAALQATLKKLLIAPQQLKNEPSMSWRYWADDGHEEFLVEEFVHSEPVVVSGKRFDGTLRAVFILQHEGDTIVMTILGYCWKLPGKSIDEKGTLLERYKSAYAAAAVSYKDKQEIGQVLAQLLPRLYEKMLYKN